MSYYYNYYLGYYGSDGKIYPLGPYTADRKEILPTLSVSRNYASDLHCDFYKIKPEQISDELRKEFEYKNFNNETVFDVKMCKYSDLPQGSFIRTGYFLIEDVRAYEETHDIWDLFSDYLSPTVYAAKLQNELKFGVNNSGDAHSASDYMFYAYPDHMSKNYESFIIQNMAIALMSYYLNEEDLVVLETEG